MKSLTLKFFIVICSVCLTTGSISALSDESINTPPLLLIDNIEVVDDMQITIQFNQNIIHESVRVRVTKQSDESNVRIDSFTGGIDQKSTKVLLVDKLLPNTAYNMTIVSAISENGILIRDGADGIKEFTTPIDLLSGAISLNAPNNPTAIKVMTGQSLSGSNEIKNTNESKVEIEKLTTTASPAETAKELPLSGMNPTIFIAFAGIMALSFLIRHKKYNRTK